jgi:hypothetical protein
MRESMAFLFEHRPPRDCHQAVSIQPTSRRPHFYGFGLRLRNEMVHSAQQSVSCVFGDGGFGVSH